MNSKQKAQVLATLLMLAGFAAVAWFAPAGRWQLLE
jgi:hypothetical protein